MRKIIRLGCLLALLQVISGCTITNYRASLTGNYKVKQLDHAVVLRVSREPLTYGTGYMPGPDWQSSGPSTCFVLIIVGEPKGALLESVRANFQYDSENPQPLVVTWIGHNQAVLYPTPSDGAEALTRPDPLHKLLKNLRYGNYKLDASYQIDGHDYKCNFDVKYTFKKVFEYHDIRELRGIN
jgi:hypothetical protein